jgi:hypothetical protein
MIDKHSLHLVMREHCFEGNLFFSVITLPEWVTVIMDVMLYSPRQHKTPPAHVTTASRLTCYYGDKPTNENSADGCDVDCKLFVLRVTYFFSPASQTQTPLYVRTHTHTRRHI